MYKRVKIKKGDTVKVISGGQKGKSGRVIEVVRRTDRVLVEGVNIITKHIKPSATNPQGGIEKREAPVHISNVMYVDGKGNATRVGRRRGDDGKLVRVSVKTKEDLK
jgi:large subunit ribosomal protein L24